MSAARFSSGTIPAEVWDRIRDEVGRLYIDEQKSLHEIRAYMQRNHGFDASTKQWKHQLAKWEFRRNLSKSDAAHILRLLIESQAAGIHRRIFFYGKEKTRRDISFYIRKSAKVQTEKDVLLEIKSTEPLPWYISYEDISNPKPSSSPPSPFTYTSGSECTLSRGPVLMSPSLFMPPDRSSPYLGSAPSSTWSLVDVREDTPSNPHCESPVSSVDQSPWPSEVQDPDLSHGGERQQRRTRDSSQQPPAASPDPPTCLLQPFVKPDPTISTRTDLWYHAMMSVTPAQGVSGMDVTERDWNKVPDLMHLTISGDQSSDQLNSRSHVASFSSNCLMTCMLRNNGQPESAEEALDHAIFDYQNVLAFELEDSLSAISTIMAVLESYGQREAARKILLRVANTLQDHGDGLPNFRLLSDTVMFFCQTQLPEYGTSGTYDIHCLRLILDGFRSQSGDDSKLTLIARYNIAWAELERKNYTDARAQLLELKPRVESIFGLYHLQSVSCAATLARAHLRCGEFVTAQALLEESVLRRAEKIFSKMHPFYWEVRHRQASFMMALCAYQIDPVHQREMQIDSEVILREVLLRRLMVLGANNPRTSSTFHVLKQLLEQQGKDEEAMNLYDWCMSNCEQSLHAG